MHDYGRCPCGGQYENRMVEVRMTMKGRYLFSWDEIPGNDNGRLIESLKQEFGISSHFPQPLI